MGSKTVSTGFNTKFSININGQEVASGNELTEEQKETVRKAMLQVKEVTGNLGLDKILPSEIKIDESKSKPVVVSNSNNKVLVIGLIIIAVYFVLKIVLKVW